MRAFILAALIATPYGTYPTCDTAAVFRDRVCAWPITATLYWDWPSKNGATYQAPAEPPEFLYCRLGACGPAPPAPLRLAPQGARKR